MSIATKRGGTRPTKRVRGPRQRGLEPDSWLDCAPGSRPMSRFFWIVARCRCRRRWKTHPPAPFENAPPCRVVAQAPGGVLNLASFMLFESGRRACLTWSVGLSCGVSTSSAGCRLKSSRDGLGSIATRSGGRCAPKVRRSIGGHRPDRSSIPIGMRSTSCSRRIPNCRACGSGS